MGENLDRLANIESQSCDRFCVIPWQTRTLLKRRPNSGLKVCRVFRPAVRRDRTEIRYVRTKKVTLRLQSPRIIERTEGLEKLTMCARSVALFQGVEPIIAGLCIDRERSVPMVIGKSSATRIISPLNSSEVPYFPRSDVSFFLRLPSSIFPSLLPSYSLGADFLIASSLLSPSRFRQNDRETRSFTLSFFRLHGIFNRLFGHVTNFDGISLRPIGFPRAF